MHEPVSAFWTLVRASRQRHVLAEKDRFYNGDDGQDSVAFKDEHKAKRRLLPADSVLQRSGKHDGS